MRFTLCLIAVVLFCFPTICGCTQTVGNTQDIPENLKKDDANKISPGKGGSGTGGGMGPTGVPIPKQPDADKKKISGDK